jgi:hypothetical protein
VEISVSDARRPDPPCPSCGATLVYVDTEVASGAFRPQAASMPLMPIHYYDCAACHTCWKWGQRLLPDPIRQILESEKRKVKSEK